MQIRFDAELFVIVFRWLDTSVQQWFELKLWP